MKKKLFVIALLFVALAIAACSNPFQRAQATATPSPTPRPTQVVAQATPAPTSTPRPEPTQVAEVATQLPPTATPQPEPTEAAMIAGGGEFQPSPTPKLAPTLQPKVAELPAVQPTVVIYPQGQTSAANDQAPCVSDREMVADSQLGELRPVQTGEGILWDPCKWNWQAYADYPGFTFKLAKNYQATITQVNGEVSVWYGPTEIPSVSGFTIRYMPAYPSDHWVWDSCALLTQEFAFGQRRDWSYITNPGNVRCSELEGVELVGHCPATPAQVAAVVGGLPRQWILRDWDGGAEVFKADQDQYIILSVPTWCTGCWIDFWNGQEERPDSYGPGEVRYVDGHVLAVNEASFHCHSLPMATMNGEVSTATPKQQTMQATPQAVEVGPIQCYVTTEMLAAAVGGNPANWTPPDWAGGAWVYGPNAPATTLCVPENSGGKIDHWSIGTLTSGCTSVPVTDGSFTCIR